MPPAPTTNELLPVVRAYVAKVRGPGATIDEATPLLGEGLLDSFALVGLIADLSSALSIELSPGELIPEDFETVKTLEGRLAELLG